MTPSKRRDAEHARRPDQQRPAQAQRGHAAGERPQQRPSRLGELPAPRVAQHLREAPQRPLGARRLADQLARDLAVQGHAIDQLVDAAGTGQRDLEQVLGIARLVAEQHDLAGEVVGSEPAAQRRLDRQRRQALRAGGERQQELIAARLERRVAAVLGAERHVARRAEPQIGAIAGRRDPRRREEARRELQRERRAGAVAAAQVEQPAAQHAIGVEVHVGKADAPGIGDRRRRRARRAGRLVAIGVARGDHDLGVRAQHARELGLARRDRPRPQQIEADRRGPLGHHRRERRGEPAVVDRGVDASQVLVGDRDDQHVRRRMRGVQRHAPAEELVVGQKLEALERTGRAQARDR